MKSGTWGLYSKSSETGLLSNILAASKESNLTPDFQSFYNESSLSKPFNPLSGLYLHFPTEKARRWLTS